MSSLCREPTKFPTGSSDIIPPPCCGLSSSLLPTERARKVCLARRPNHDTFPESLCWLAADVLHRSQFVPSSTKKKNRNTSTATRISWFPSLLTTTDWAAGHSCSRTNLSQHPPQLLDMPLQRVVAAKHGGRLHSRRTCPRQWTL